MAGAESIAARARRVMLAVVTLEQMARAMRLEANWRGVDVASFAYAVWEVASEVEVDAAAVSEALERARVVSFRVIE